MLGLPALGPAAANLFDATVRGGLADLRRMPAEVIDQGPQRTVSRYLPATTVRRSPAPVLLVPPLAAPAICFDLRRTCSLAEHLVQAGRSAYLLDYGPIEFADRSLGLEHWVHDVIPAALRAVSADAGDRRVRIVGWCLGGIMSALAHAAHAELPVESIALVASPWDVAKVPLVAPLRPIDAMTRGWLVTQLYRMLGGAPAPLVKRGYQLAGFGRRVHGLDARLPGPHLRPALPQLPAHERPRRRAHGARRRRGRHGRCDRAAGDRRARRRDRSDRGLPPPRRPRHRSRRGAARDAPGGHLGVLTGRAARGTTWAMLDAWLERPARRRRRARRVARAAAD